MNYSPNKNRYLNTPYSRVGESGLKLPLISLGLWHNFGSDDDYKNMKEMCRTAFDLGITHFDLANNYGPLPGSAEENFGKILKEDFLSHRDELIISTKAGYRMWNGPYGDGGSRKYLLASLDASLKRLNLPYVDIFYHHCMDKDTPLEESMGALYQAVKSGKALYAGLSNYDGETMEAAAEILKDLHCPFVINQNRYNILDRTIEKNGVISSAKKLKKGIIAFSPLNQGILSDRYLERIPENSRAAKNEFLKASEITSARVRVLGKLKSLAEERGQTLAQMALSWVLKDTAVTGVLIGASKPSQIKENVGLINASGFTEGELKDIDALAEEFYR